MAEVDWSTDAVAVGGAGDSSAADGGRGGDADPLYHERQ